MQGLNEVAFMNVTTQARQACASRGCRSFTTFLSGGTCAGRAPLESSQASSTGGVGRTRSQFSRCFPLLLFGLGILAFLALRPQPLFAQATDGTLLGQVSDPTGLPVPGVKITARQAQTNYVRTTETDAVGGYILLSMPVGSYTITAEKTGFTRNEQTGIQLTVGTQVRTDIHLVVGSVTQNVEVTGQASMVNTTSAQVSGLVDSARIVELPLQGRNIAALTALQPGVSDVSAPQSQVNGDEGNTMNVNGGRVNMFAEYVDGGLFQELVFNYGLLLPPPDAIQEFRMLLNNYAPEYGRNNGASISAVTKSGTNQLHGTAYEFVRNNVLNARSFFFPSVTPSRQNQFGASAGYYIPVTHGKRLYLFGDYEGLRVRTAASESSAFLPTAAERAGVFPPDHIITDPTTGQPFPNNTIPTDRLNQVALNILGKLPTPTSANGQLLTFAAAPEDVNKYFFRGDYDITPKHRLTVSGFTSRDSQTFALSRSTTVPGWSPGSRENYNTSVNVGLTSTLSPTLLNEFHLGAVTENDPFANNSTFDLHSLGSNFPSTGVPPWIIVGGDFSLEPNVGGFDENRDSWLSDTLSWVKGRNTVKTGFQIWRERMRFTCNWLVPSQSLFDGSITGDPIADFLLGSPVTFITLEGSTLDDTTTNIMGAFVQDDIKVKPRLTLNLGLRWDLQTPWRCPENLFGIFLPGHQSTLFPDAPPDFVYPGDAGIPPGETPTRWAHFSPRFGFAWDAFGDGKTAVRGGFGVFFGTLIQDAGETVESPPFQVYSYFVDPPGGLSNPLEGEPSIFPSSSSFVLPISTFFKDWHQTQPYSMGFNLTVERQIRTNWSAQVAYVGNQGRRLYNQIEANPAIPGPGATVANEQQRRPYNPWYSSMLRGTTDANSEYNSLQARLERRLARNYTVLASYTWSRSFDDDSGISEGDGVTNPFDSHWDFGPSNFDRRQVFALSFVSYLPQWHGSSGTLRNLANGWEFTGIASYKTGIPINVVAGYDTDFFGDGYENYGQERPELVGPQTISHANKAAYIQEYFNTNAYAFPCPVPLVAGSCQVPALGNLGRNTLTGPGNENWDLGLFKNTGVTERVKTQFRAEFFDAFNHANFSNPLSNMSEAQFGTITSASPGRTIQFSLKLLF
jgi:hypothetical protein